MSPFLLGPTGPLAVTSIAGAEFQLAHLPTRSPAATRTSADGPPLAGPHDASSPDPDGGTS